MPQTTTSDQEQGIFLPRWVWFGFAVLIPIAYLVGLSFPLVGPDEPRYAQVAREMMERGDWITPTLGGHTWFEKPVLLYWLEIVAYKTFGVNEAAARLGPALFGLGTIAALFVIVLSLRKTHGSGIGGWFAIAGASTLGLLVFAHGASFDIIVTFPITAAMACFWKYDESERDSTPQTVWLLASYAFVGVALLAKGLIGVVFPYGIVALYLTLSRRLPSRTLIFSLVWGTLLASLVASVWYAPMYMRHGWHFIDEFIIQHHFARFTSNKYQHPQPFYFFLWVLPLMTLPWLPFALKGFWEALKKVVKTVDDGSSAPILLFSLSWVLVPLAFFSVSGSKLPGYILPAVPGAVILAGGMTHAWMSRRRTSKIALSIVAAAVLVAVPIAALTIVPRYAANDSVKPLIEASNNAGHGGEKVLMLYTVEHNAEFYAAGRLERDGKGDLIRHDGGLEIVNYIRANGGSPVLVIVPNEHADVLAKESGLVANTIAHNTELTIISTSLR